MSVFDVGSYIIEQLGEIATMKLQKLVYYCQAWSLVWDDKSLFDEEFEAWADGPVCKELFALHRGQFSISNTSFFSAHVSSQNFSDAEKETMDSVIDFYGNKESYWLSNLVRSELPWIEARGDCKDEASCSNIVSKVTMRQYYSGLR